MLQPINVFEHGFLAIGDRGFRRHHWEACLKLNERHGDRYFYVRHNGLQFRQYVGVIQVDDLTLQIHPKADKNDSERRWHGVLLSMLQACGKLKADTVDAANLNRQDLNLLEIYFSYFLDEIEKLMRTGLVKQYRCETSNVKALKGKLEFAGHLRHNLVHGERFYTTHQVYDINHELNRVLACALEIVEQLTRGHFLSDRCRRLCLGFPEVDRLVPSEQLLGKIRLNRKTAPYERALELAKLIILNYSPDICSGSHRMIALLFDMNRLWEEYVYITMDNHLRKHQEGWSVFEQDNKPFWGSNYLKPDLVVKGPNKEVFIIDTKWKCPGNSPSAGDIRQVYAYARLWNAEKVMLLYPGETGAGDYTHFTTADFRTDEKNSPIEIKHCCTMGFLSVPNESSESDTEAGKRLFEMLLN